MRCREVLEAPGNGSIISIPEAENFFYEDVISFACDRGFRIERSNRSVCTATGEWSNPTPTCRGGVQFFSQFNYQSFKNLFVIISPSILWICKYAVNRRLFLMLVCMAMCKILCRNVYRAGESLSLSLRWATQLLKKCCSSGELLATYTAP